MAYSPSLVPTLNPPGTPPDNLVKNLATEISDPDLACTIADLRAIFERGETDLDGMAMAIAEAAHKVTSATAAAVAVRRKGVVTCRGRSGDLAPDVGTRLSVDSGISGECLRTGKVLRCDDALKDFRADPEVCRRLGLRSIAAVPMRGSGGTTGVVEAFSTRPFAFADEHMDALRQLAELAEQVRAHNKLSALAAPDERSLQPNERLNAISDATVRMLGVAAARSRALASILRHGLFNRRVQYVAIAVALAIVITVPLLAWKPWRRAKELSASSATPTSPSPPSAAPSENTTKPPDAKADFVWSPPATAKKPVQQAALVERAKAETTETVRRVVPPDAATNAKPAEGVNSPEAEHASLPPVAVMASNPSKGLGGLLGGSAKMPQLTAPVSSGVVAGVPIRRVSPVYPASAVPLRLEGAVVLQATVGEDGKVRNLSTVSGDPRLARAAIDAVSQWRYRPYSLNGKPVPMETQITINFKLP